MPKAAQSAKRKTARKARPTAKTAPKAAVKATVAKPPAVTEIFKALEKVLALYSPPLKLWVSGTHSKPSARLTIPVPVAIPGIYSGKPIDLEVASLVPVKAAVAVHYLPLYMKPTLKSKIPPSLRKCLKGLTCFHINSTHPAVLEDVRKIIDVGTQFYRDRGYL